MSSLIQAPPPSISIGGGPGGPGGPAGGPDAGAGDPDAGSVTSLLKKAMALVTQAASLEKDDVDAASLTDIAAKLHKAVANEQATKDAALGAGPATKMIRKAAPAGGGGGGY